jgi:hypothetical protein
VAITVEDGSVVTGANSYATVVATKAFAAERGIDLPAVDADIEKLLINAMDYLEGLRSEYQGSKTAKTNPLQWPRSGVVVDGFVVDTDEIPTCLVQAQMQLACDCYELGDLAPVGDGRVVVKERVEGAVEIGYADHGDSNPQPQLTAAMKLLEPLLNSGLFGGAGTAIRV